MLLLTKTWIHDTGHKKNRDQGVFGVLMLLLAINQTMDLPAGEHHIWLVESYYMNNNTSGEYK